MKILQPKIGTAFDCAIGAMLSHDGFQWPGSGDYYHTLHHLHFDCNYGNPQIPFDWLFGTYISNKSDLQKLWGRTSVGKKANTTALHEPEKQK